MSCYSPAVVEMSYNKFEKKYNVRWIGHVDKDYLDKEWRNLQLMPCGKCIGCNLSKARDWSVRCYLESLSWEKNYFITFTYSDDYLPYLKSYDIPTLCPDDMSKFINSLRKHFLRKGHKGIRYLGAGEYGSRYGRPHYHYNFFNLPLYDLKFVGSNSLGQKYYSSELINNLWNKGHVVIGEFSFETAGYVARYTTKKIGNVNSVSFGVVPDFDFWLETLESGSVILHKKKRKFEKEFDQVPEYLRVSTSPGIGYLYFEKNYEKIYKYDGLYVVNSKGSYFVRPPRYFDRKMMEIDYDLVFDLKKKRYKISEDKFDIEFGYTDKSFTEYLGTLQSELYAHIKFLKKEKKEVKREYYSPTLLFLKEIFESVDIV